MSFTKGKYQFVVATTYRSCPYPQPHQFSIPLQFTIHRNAENFLRSSEAIRKISDKLCLENGLSIILGSKAGTVHYGKWRATRKPLSSGRKLSKPLIPSSAQKPADFRLSSKLMVEYGYEVKQGQYLAFKASGQQKFTSTIILGEGYSEDE